MVRKQAPNVRLHYVDSKKDLQEVVRISRAHFGDAAWTARKVRRFMDSRIHIPEVIVVRNRVVGYIVYLLHEHTVEIVQIAIALDYQRQGVGSEAVRRVTTRVAQMGKTLVFARVPEHNLPLQLFFQQLGFEWDRTLHGNRDDAEYVMKYVVSQRLRDSRRLNDLYEQARDQCERDPSSLQENQEARQFLRSGGRAGSGGADRMRLEELVEALYLAGAEQVVFAGIRTLRGRQASAWIAGKFPNGVRVKAKVSAMLLIDYPDVWDFWELVRRGGARYIDIWLE